MSPRAYWLLCDRRQQNQAPDEGERERRSGSDRRKDNRLRLSLEVAVPILVACPAGLQRGLARNISEGGMLIELRELPPIGSTLTITIAQDALQAQVSPPATQGQDSPERVELTAEVRHQVAWQHWVRGKRQTMRGVGVRFVERPSEPEHLPEWVWAAGRTVH